MKRLFLALFAFGVLGQYGFADPTATTSSDSQEGEQVSSDEASASSKISAEDYSDAAKIQTLEETICAILKKSDDDDEFRYVLNKISLEPAFLQAVIHVFESDPSLWRNMLVSNSRRAIFLLNYLTLAVANMIEQIAPEGYNTIHTISTRIFNNLFFVDNHLILNDLVDVELISAFVGLIDEISRYARELANVLVNTDAHGRTILHRVIQNCGDSQDSIEKVLNVVELIIKLERKFPDNIIDKKDEDGNTALIIAAQEDIPSVVSLLIRSGAKVNERNNDGKTARDYTKKRSESQNNLGEEAKKGWRVSVNEAKDKVFGKIDNVKKRVKEIRRFPQDTRILLNNPRAFLENMSLKVRSGEL